MVVVNKYKSSDIYFFTETVELAAFTGVILAKFGKNLRVSDLKRPLVLMWLNPMKNQFHLHGCQILQPFMWLLGKPGDDGCAGSLLLLARCSH